MSDVILQILSALGIILLILLCLAVAALLIVLFLPVKYLITGRKNAEELSFSVKADWLFGALRLRYAYPEPRRLTIRFLWRMLYDSDRRKEEHGEQEAEERTESTEEETAQDAVLTQESLPAAREPAMDTGQEPEGNSEPAMDAGQEPERHSEPPDDMPQAGKEDHPENTEEAEDSDWFSKKFAKIKFTIRNTYDKIKKIWQNISYYADLLREDETKLVFSDAIERLKKILKSIRPRKLRVNVLFGTGEPDATGYVLGVYGIFSPVLGPGVAVTPDFEQAVFEGDLYASGYITSAILFWHFVIVFLDKRYGRFLARLKKSDGASGEDQTAPDQKGHRKKGRKRKNRKKRINKS